MKRYIALAAALLMSGTAWAGPVEVTTSDFDGQTVVTMKRSHAGCDGSKCTQFTSEWRSETPNAVIVTVHSNLDSILDVSVNIDGETYEFGSAKSLTLDNAIGRGFDRLDFGGENHMVAPLALYRQMAEGERIRLRVSGAQGFQDYKTADPGKKPMQFIRRLPEFLEAVDAQATNP